MVLQAVQSTLHAAHKVAVTYERLRDCLTAGRIISLPAALAVAFRRATERPGPTELASYTYSSPLSLVPCGVPQALSASRHLFKLYQVKSAALPG